MVFNPAAVLAHLQEQTVRDQIFLDECLERHGDAVDERIDDPDSAQPIIDKVLDGAGLHGFKVMTNFTLTEFDVLWDIVQLPMKARWTEGRGSKTTTKPRDALYMALTVMKHYHSWEKHAVDFGYKAPTFQKLITRTFDTIRPALYERFVSMPTMTDLRARQALFAHYPCALYATDVKFQPCERPGGRFNERKAWFSGKHKLYGMKLEASVSPQGFCVDMSGAHVGATHDLTILRSRLAEHVAALSKQPNEHAEYDSGEHSVLYPGTWALLVDMGYCGVLDHLRGIHPKKKPVGGYLNAEDTERNRRVSSDRVVVENFFGRVCLLWKISYATFCWGHDTYEGIQRLTFALTNFHVSLMPLRASDGTCYRSVLARYVEMAQEKIEDKRKRQQQGRRRRLERIALGRGLTGGSLAFTSPMSSQM